VEAGEEHLAALVEGGLGAVAVMDVPVEDQHSLGAVCRQGVPRGDRCVRKEAEAHRAVGLGVVAGRAQRSEAGRRSTAQQRVDERAGPACGVQRGVPGGWHHRGVGIERLAAGAGVAHPFEMLGGMDGQQLLLAGPRRLGDVPAEPVAGHQRRLQRTDAVRPLGVQAGVVLDR
jgi:hypothetical protein